MRMKRFGVALAAVAVGAGLIAGVSGCQAQRQLKVGLVDTDRIVRESPKYMELKVMLADERQQFLGQFPNDTKNMTDSQISELRKKLGKDYKDRSDKLSKQYLSFLKKLTEDIRGAAESVAADRSFDLIIVDSPTTPTVHYNSGENLTTDILLKLNV